MASITTSLFLLIQTLNVLNVVKLDILLGPALRGRATPVFLSEVPGAAAAPDLTESEPQAQPAAQEPTGATPAPDKPRKTEPAVAEPRSARPDRKKPWSTEKSSVGSGAVLEPPALTEAGTEVQGNRMETLDTTPVQGDGGDVDMVDEPVFKVPNKRKKQGKGQGKKQAKKETKVEEGESDSDDRISDSVLTFDSQEEQINYTLNITRDIVRSLKALEIEIVELQRSLSERPESWTGSCRWRSFMRISRGWRMDGHQVNWTKSEAILVGEWGGGQPTLPGGLAWKRGGFKYLGVYLGTNEFLNKNWEGSLEHMKGRLSRWKRLVPKMSYWGRTLVINNLAASSLWHKLVCVDPPPNLLANIQAQLVDFFWDGLHWIPQSDLHLPKEEGGQGLVQLSSRAAAFQLQFIQRLLTGPRDLVWRAAASGLLCTVKGLGLDRALFLMDTKMLDIS
ncbi:hypothetical protein QTP86_005124 [Hemibagrus guttatus]|nr:hypothetical protein QTP86_005124 [Hemibagrus guttatus]